MVRWLRFLVVFAVATFPLVDSASAQTLKSKHYFSEGINVPGWDTHFYITNPAPFEHVVRMSVMGESQWPTGREIRIAPGQTVGISMAHEFFWYRDTFATSFETVNNNGVGYLSVQRYVLRDGIGVLTHATKDAPPVTYRTFAPCNPGAAHTYLTLANPNYEKAFITYNTGSGFQTMEMQGKSRKTVYAAGDPSISVFAPYTKAGVVSEKVTYNANMTAAKLCPGS